MIANLLDNAIQHNTPDGSVELTTGRVTAASQLSIRNSGPIVPTTEVQRLFQPFQQLGHNRTGSGEGHGLGLAIVQAIAQAHHATITAHPRSSGGLDIEVRFHLPGNSEVAISPP
jgi:signal transduction histidine kinase